MDLIIYFNFVLVAFPDVRNVEHHVRLNDADNPAASVSAS